MPILTRVILDRAHGGARNARIVGMAALAVAALGPGPVANAAPAPVCPQEAPGQVSACARHAFLADIAAAGLSDSNGNGVALDQGVAICGLMDAGLSRPSMESQFLATNPALGPDGAAQVVGIAIRDLCPWHH